MSSLATYFIDFLEEIRLTPHLRDACERVHKDLRERLLADPTLRQIIIEMFLQGSYRRHTGVRPSVDGDHIDVDLVVVTTLDNRQYTPEMVVARFRPFLDREYRGQWTATDRSMKISPTGSPVTIDLVVTSAPSKMQQEFLKSMGESWRMEAKGDAGPLVLTEALTRLRKSASFQQWQDEPLLIPSRDLRRWEPTHPLEQIRWTIEKNDRTNQHYVNAVKALKWWRRRFPDGEYPKGYPLEHIVGVSCADDVNSVALAIVTTFETIRDTYRIDAMNRRVPTLPDHGVRAHNVFARVTPDQFAIFWRLVDNAASIARAAINAETIAESATLWRRLFGPEFPDGSNKPTGFIPPQSAARPVSGGRFG